MPIHSLAKLQELDLALSIASQTAHLDRQCIKMHTSLIKGMGERMEEQVQRIAALESQVAQLTQLLRQEK